jgi:alpha-tubulin suppressor-like RCC1 family protein
VLAGGEVWTWGGNEWGQLGYTLQQKASKEEPFQSTPCQVFGLLKKENVIGCAASRTHTAVFTSDSLFTFGKNDGQLGILDSSDARALASQSAPRKVAANFLNRVKISEVVALDKATAILLENHEVWILAGYGYSKLSLSMEVVGLPAGATNITRYDTRPNFVRKITGGGDTLCALSRTGDVYTIDVAATLLLELMGISLSVQNLGASGRE